MNRKGYKLRSPFGARHRRRESRVYPPWLDEEMRRQNAIMEGRAQERREFAETLRKIAREQERQVTR